MLKFENEAEDSGILSRFTFDVSRQNNIMKKTSWLILLGGVVTQTALSQNKYELNNGWVCSPIGSVKATGEKISAPSYSIKGWMPATVPGTVLTTLLDNKKVPDPFYGMNN